LLDKQAKDICGLAQGTAKFLKKFCGTVYEHSTVLACLHDQNKSSFFLEDRLLTSQSEQFKKYSKRSDWLRKSWPSKKATWV